MAFEPAAAAVVEAAEGQAAGEEAVESVSTALAKRRLLEGKFYLLQCDFRRLPLLLLTFALLKFFE